MNWFSTSGGMIRIGSLEFPSPFLVLWLLVIFYLAAGYVLHVGKWTGIHIYARKREPFDYWMDCLFYLGVTVALTIWWKQIVTLGR